MWSHTTLADGMIKKGKGMGYSLFEVLIGAADRGYCVEIAYDSVFQTYEIKIQERGEEDYSKKFISAELLRNRADPEMAFVQVISEFTGQMAKWI